MFLFFTPGSTYCGGQTIYNPAAPPPSANYSAMPYQPGGVGGGTGSGGALDTTTNSSMMFHQQPHQQRTVSSSGEDLKGSGQQKSGVFSFFSPLNVVQWPRTVPEAVEGQW